MLFRKPCILSQDHGVCPVTSQGAVCPHTQAISVRNGQGNCVSHLWTVGCASTAERTEIVVSIASCLFFFFFSFFPLSFLSLLWRTSQQKHYSCPCWISCAVLSVCISQSLVRPLTRPLYFLVVFLNRPFIRSPWHLPPLVHRPTVHRTPHLLGIIPIR